VPLCGASAGLLHAARADPLWYGAGSQWECTAATSAQAGYPVWSRHGHGAAAISVMAGAQIVLLGGADAEGTLYRDLWASSADGKLQQWTLVSQYAEFSARTNFATVVHSTTGTNYLWVIGGVTVEFDADGGNAREVFLNDVWRMPLWQSRLSGEFEEVSYIDHSSSFTPRAYSLAVSLRGFIYLIGGCSGAQCADLQQDVLVSASGTYWQLVQIMGYDGPTDFLWSEFLFEGLGRLMGTVTVPVIVRVYMVSVTVIVRVYMVSVTVIVRVYMVSVTVIVRVRVIVIQGHGNSNRHSKSKEYICHKKSKSNSHPGARGAHRCAWRQGLLLILLRISYYYYPTTTPITTTLPQLQ
jgi:hypothetical protein